MAKKEKPNKDLEFLQSMKKKDNEYLPTQIIPIDMVTSGGLCRGDMIEMTGPSGTGKSTAILDIFAHLLGQGERCIYFDVERGIHDDILEKMNLKPYVEAGQLEIQQPGTYAELEIGMNYALNNFNWAVVDSLTAVIRSEDLVNSVESNAIGTNARVQTKFLQKWRILTHRASLGVIFITQFRTKIGIGLYDHTETKGSNTNAFQHYCDVRLQVTPGYPLRKNDETWKGKDLVAFGNLAKIHAIKNRSGRGSIKVPLPVIFGKGISNPFFYYAVLDENKLIGTRGSSKFIDIEGFEEFKSVGEIGLVKKIGANQEKIHQWLEDNGKFILVSDLKEKVKVEGSEELEDSEEDIEE